MELLDPDKVHRRIERLRLSVQQAIIDVRDRRRETEARLERARGLIVTSALMMMRVTGQRLVALPPRRVTSSDAPPAEDGAIGPR
jgi:hypothetical protein